MNNQTRDAHVSRRNGSLINTLHGRCLSKGSYVHTDSGEASSSRKVPDLRNIRLTVYVDRLYCLVEFISVDVLYCSLTVYVDVLYFGNVMPGSIKFEISIPFAFSTRKDLHRKAQYR